MAFVIAPELQRSTRRFELYVRVTLHLGLAMELVALLVMVAGAGSTTWRLWPWLLCFVVHLALTQYWAYRLVSSIRPRRPFGRHDRLGIAGWLLVSLLAAALMPWALGIRSPWPANATLVLVVPIAVLSLRMRWWPPLLITAAIVVAAGLPMIWIAGMDASTLSGYLTAMLLLNCFLVATFWLTGWMLRVVQALDEARGQSAQLAIAEERLRISRDLHDTFGQTLATISVKSELARELARRGHVEAALAELGAIHDVADEAGRQVRQVVAGVRGADLPQELIGARALLSSAGVACRSTGSVDPAALPSALRTTLGAVLREAVTNVIRHSEAREVELGLRREAEEVVLEVVNDGAHRDPGPIGGLAGMADRMAAVGGTLTHRVDSAAGATRFHLVARAPMQATEIEPGPATPAAIAEESR